jgi:hypothetical protein
MRRPGLVAGPFRKIFFVFLYFYFNGLSETNFQIWPIYFLGCKGFGLFVFAGLMFGFGCLRGLTCDFWAENDGKKIQRQKRRQ